MITMFMCYFSLKKKKRWAILTSPVPSLLPLVGKWISNMFCAKRLWSNAIINRKLLRGAINAELLYLVGAGVERESVGSMECNGNITLQDMVLLIYSLFRIIYLILSFLLSNVHKS